MIKKYSDDGGGQLAAMLTYYGFLSLFPLLLVATSVLQIILHAHPTIKDSIISHVTQYFPALSDQLQSNVHTVKGAGVALAIGIFLALWGAKGVADIFQISMNRIWGFPHYRQPGFPKGPLKSLGIIFVGALGLILASFSSGLAASLDKAFVFRLISVVVGTVVLFGFMWLIYKLGLASSNKVKRSALIRSALIAAIAIEILQLLGGYLVTHELRNLKHLYGTFAVTLGLLFWIFIEARVVIYAAEAGVVHDKKLWPRALDQNNLTDADKKVFGDAARKERYVPPQKVDVSFKKK